MTFYGRTTLQSEPILGGQKLDLLKLYKEVMASGGYQQVMERIKDIHSILSCMSATLPSILNNYNFTGYSGSYLEAPRRKL
jgi:hypothetical protein